MTFLVNSLNRTVMVGLFDDARILWVGRMCDRNACPGFWNVTFTPAVLQNLKMRQASGDGCARTRKRSLTRLNNLREIILLGVSIR